MTMMSNQLPSVPFVIILSIILISLMHDDFSVAEQDYTSGVLKSNRSSHVISPVVDYSTDDKTKHEEEEEEEKEEKEEEEDDDDDDEHDAAEDEEDEEEEQHWKYDGIYGPSNWMKISKDCDSDRSMSRQSPIDIVPSSTKLDELLTDIHLVTHKIRSDQMTLVNNGYSVNCIYNNSVARIVGGDLGHTYRVIGIHFHWGKNDNVGSEHTIEGKQFPLELHIVSYDEELYDGVSDAINHPDGLAVLGVLFTLSSTNNEDLQPIISNLKNIQPSGAQVILPYFDLKRLLPSNRKNYYRYKGSLTTPPCSESVIWTVFETKQFVSSSQLKEFRELYEAVRSTNVVDYLEENWRPTQPIAKRIVYRSFTSSSSVHPISTKKDAEMAEAVPTLTAAAGRVTCRTNDVIISSFAISLVCSFLLPRCY